jgi:hypothetical protein
VNTDAQEIARDKKLIQFNSSDHECYKDNKLEEKIIHNLSGALPFVITGIGIDIRHHCSLYLKVISRIEKKSRREKKHTKKKLERQDVIHLEPCHSSSLTGVSLYRHHL